MARSTSAFNGTNPARAAGAGFLPDIDTCAAGDHHGEGAAICVHDRVHIVRDFRHASQEVAEMIPDFGEGIGSHISESHQRGRASDQSFLYEPSIRAWP
jgi:hypothetical protein